MGEAKVDPSQTITEPDTADLAWLQDRRASVHAWVAPESQASLATPAGKLGLIRALLAAETFRPDHTAALQALGIVLGDVLVQHLADARWVMVEDAWGRDPAVTLDGTSLLLFPLTMISKRVEAGEQVDVFALFNGIVDHVASLRAG